MLHRGKVHHESGGSEIVNRGPQSFLSRSEHSLFERGDGTLPVGLTEGDHSDSGSYQIGDITLQEGGQREIRRNSVLGRGDSVNDGQCRRNLLLPE